MATIIIVTVLVLMLGLLVHAHAFRRGIKIGMEEGMKIASRENHFRELLKDKRTDDEMAMLRRIVNGE